MKPSHPEKDNPRGGCVASSADKAAAQPEKGAPGKGERRSPSPVEDATDGGVIEEVERTGAEERIRFQAELLDRVGEAVIALDLESRVVYWNRAAEGLYGWSSEEVMGRNLTEMVVPDDLRGRAEQVKRQVIETGNWLGEFVVRRKDGTCFPVVANNTLVHDEQGNVGGVISVLRDVTEDKRAEEALKESEQRFRSAFEDAPIGVALVATDMRYLRVNQALCEMLGYTEEGLLEKTSPELIHPEDREISMQHAQEALEEGIDSYTLERRYVRADGHVAWNLTSVSLIRDSQGDPATSSVSIRTQPSVRRRRTPCARAGQGSRRCSRTQPSAWRW